MMIGPVRCSTLSVFLMSLVLRSSSRNNPFHGIDVGYNSAPAFVDWDQDGGLGLVVGVSDGAVHYYERLPDGSLVERSGAGNNPFYGIDVKGNSAPGFVAYFLLRLAPELLAGCGKFYTTGTKPHPHLAGVAA